MGLQCYRHADAKGNSNHYNRSDNNTRIFHNVLKIPSKGAKSFSPIKSLIWYYNNIRTCPFAFALSYFFLSYNSNSKSLGLESM